MIKTVENDIATLEKMAEAIKTFLKVDGFKIEFQTIREINGASGRCWPKLNVQFGYYVRFRKTIKISKDIDILQIASTLMHEIRHHLQYEEGRLENVYDKDGDFVGFVFDGINYDGDYEYELRPWEVEANRFQEVAFRDFVTKYEDKALLKEILELHTKGQKKNGNS